MPDFSGLLDGLPALLERVSTFLQFFALVCGALFAAFWVALIVWTIKDIRARSRDIFSQILAVLLVALFPLIGLALYLLMRPKDTLAEAYDRALEEEALLQSLEERLTCPKCHHRVEKEFLLCPVCYTPLKKPCVDCGRLLSLEWDVCPYCGHMSEVTRPAPPRREALEEPPLPVMDGPADREREDVKDSDLTGF
jgi:RNA polymerase subunit RPABC4/transcription elongation factor Spt4